MNNEPVAIVNTNCENNIQWNVLKPQSYNGYFLYTHPAKTDKAELDTRSYMLGYADGKEVKTLTDEEIDAISDAVSNLIDTYAGRREFAKAILRKAQEG